MSGADIKGAALAALAVIGTAIINMLGGWDAVLKVLVGFMATDYITGLLVAFVWHNSPKSGSGAASSAAGWKGLCRKLVILLYVGLAVGLDYAIGTDYVRTAVCLFFIGNEGLSILENGGLMGIEYPVFLKKALEATRDRAGEKIEEEEK